MSVFAAWLLLVLARSFLVAAVTHVRHLERLAGVLSMIGVSPRIAPAVAVIDAGVVLLLFLVSSAGAGAALLYLSVVTVVLTKRGWGALDCGCSAEPEPVDHRLLLRNAGLVIAASVVLLAGIPAVGTIESLTAAGLFAAHMGIEKAIREVARRGVPARRFMFRAPA